MTFHNRLGLVCFLWAIILTSSLSPNEKVGQPLGIMITLFVVCGTVLLLIGAE